jgi:acetolactate synthase-1/2/3 large subunit
VIKPHAIQRLYEPPRPDAYITKVGQHQMGRRSFPSGAEPLDDLGGLGTMGYGLPAAVGVQLAHPNSLVIDIAGEASVQMTMQEMSTAAQYRLPIKVFILNNKYMGMVRQWQELLHGGRYSESYSEALPDFVNWRAYHARHPLRSRAISTRHQMIKRRGRCCSIAWSRGEFLPMIPSGRAHNGNDLGDARLKVSTARSPRKVGDDGLMSPHIDDKPLSGGADRATLRRHPRCRCWSTTGRRAGAGGRMFSARGYNRA